MGGQVLKEGLKYVGVIILEEELYTVFRDAAGNLYREVMEGTFAHYEMLERNQWPLVETVTETDTHGPVEINERGEVRHPPTDDHHEVPDRGSPGEGRSEGVIIDTPPREQGGGGGNSDDDIHAPMDTGNIA